MDESWLVLACACLWVLAIARLAVPPGPSFTSAWLFTGLQGYLLKSDDVMRLFYVSGVGLMLGWYGVQILDQSAWQKILNIWIPKFPWAPRTPLSIGVRIGDLYLHALPFYWALNFCQGVGAKHLLQAIMFDRFYFLAIDGMLVGDGRVVNRVYRIVPRAPPRFFWTLQALSLFGHLCAYFTSAEKSEIEYPVYSSAYPSIIAQEVVGLLESKMPFVTDWLPDQWYTMDAPSAGDALPTSHVLYGTLILIATIKAHTMEFYQRYYPPARYAITTRYKKFSPLVLRSR